MSLPQLLSTKKGKGKGDTCGADVPTIMSQSGDHYECSTGFTSLLGCVYEVPFWAASPLTTNAIIEMVGAGSLGIV